MDLVRVGNGTGEGKQPPRFRHQDSKNVSRMHSRGLDDTPQVYNSCVNAILTSK